MANNDKLTAQQVREIAELANIQIDDKDLAKYGEQISEILEYFKKISEVDTEKIEIVSHLETKNVSAPDDPRPSLSQDEVISNRKNSSHNGYFVVKSVLDKKKK